MDNLSEKFDQWLKSDGPVAIIIKHHLRPVEGHGEIIFPPTYPMPTYRGRIHTVRDGDYRVSVELPPFRYENNATEKKGEENGQKVSGYNIDEFKDGSNICEIDSPQSQANRLEPLFKTIKNGSLVPQVTIKAGNETVHLLDAGHRAADAVVRLSSLVADFHDAFMHVRKGNHLKLAILAPTSLLFGIWDSRATQVKLPRVIKSEIRATNVHLCTRSAQFNPAIDYVQAGVVDQDLDKGSGEKNPLGAEGMKHVPAPRAAGGVKVLGEITRTFRINLIALRNLQAWSQEKNLDPEKICQLQMQRYLLGLALVAATQPLQLNLREGCLLCQDEKRLPVSKLVLANGNEEPFVVDEETSVSYAEEVAKVFFGESFDSKNRDAEFRTGVANRFLAMSADDRKKLARLGPITADQIRRFEEMGRDPFKLVLEATKEAKKKLPKKAGGKKASPVVVPDLFSGVKDKLDELTLSLHKFLGFIDRSSGIV